jgi:tryptophanyl-tRNA synthetase
VNAKLGQVFVLPQEKVDESVMLIPGTDGQKMSKSRNNVIDIFEDEKALKKRVMNIASDSTPLEAPKNPDTCNIFSLYALIASEEDVSVMRKNYLDGGYGYGHAKQALLEAILQRFKKEREVYSYFMAHPLELEEVLRQGAQKAEPIANQVIARFRKQLGLF